MRRLIITMGLASMLWLSGAGLAVAADPPPVACAGLAGCPSPSPTTAAPIDRKNVLENVIPRIAGLLIIIASGAAVLFVVISGVQMVLSNGDDAKISKGKNGIIYGLGGLGLCVLAATIVEAVATEAEMVALSHSDGRDAIIGIMAASVSVILALFNVTFLIMVMYAGIRLVLSGGKTDEYEKSTKMIKWAITGAIVVNAGRAIVQAFLAIRL